MQRKPSASPIKRRRAPRHKEREVLVRCPDCEMRGDLDSLGRVRKDRYHRVKDCEGCGGKARAQA